MRGSDTPRIVNFGCGLYANPSHENLDGSLTVLLARLPFPERFFSGRQRFVRALRLTKIGYARAHTLRFPRESLDGFYASHVLQHLGRRECESLLGRCHAWLKPSGVLRVALPDLMRAAHSYVSGEIDANRFVGHIALSTEGLGLGSVLFGHVHHRWMYDAGSFRELLGRTGFRTITQCAFREGRMEELAQLDVAGRETDSFYIEAIP